MQETHDRRTPVSRLYCCSQRHWILVRDIAVLFLGVREATLFFLLRGGKKQPEEFLRRVLGRFNEPPQCFVCSFNQCCKEALSSWERNVGLRASTDGQELGAGRAWEAATLFLHKCCLWAGLLR